MKRLYFIFILASLLLLSCSKGTVKGKTDASFIVEEKGSRLMSKNMPMEARATADFAYTDGLAVEEAVYESEALSSGLAENISNQERKLIKNGSLQLEVESLSEAEAAIKNWCNSYGGYIESNNVGGNFGSMSVRIPSSHFEEAMDSAGNIGIVKSKNTSTQDVSDSFYDLQTRLETKKIMRQRLQKYLESAKDVKDMLQIERELNSVISDIESMEGRMKRLNGQIDYSQIYVNYELPYRSDENHSFVMPDFGDGFRRFLSNVLDFFIAFVKIICYIIVFGIPLLAALAFFYWLLFGKLGLLKKLFKKLRGK